MLIYIALALLVTSVAAPIIYYNGGTKNAARGKRALAANIAVFVAAFAAATVFLFTKNAYAAEGTAVKSDFAVAAAFIGAALVTGMCCIGTGVAVGSAATAAIGAISENEKVMGKALIFVAMAEGIAIYGLLISFMILGSV